MNRTIVDRIVNAVLYEGYILYPYRPSVKNCQRWTFGGLYPEAYCQDADNADAASNQTECLVEGGPETTVDVTVRFLHLIDRQIAELVHDSGKGIEPGFRRVPRLQIGDTVHHSWQEAEERTVELGNLSLNEIAEQMNVRRFTFSGNRRSETLRRTDGEIAGIQIREQQTIAGSIEVKAECALDGLHRLTVRVINQTPFAEADHRSRDNALLHSFVSAHVILSVHGGQFVSLTDPPERCQSAASRCRNIGVWPVLVGAEGARDTMLSSPIILYDYPQVAPESPGDLFDGTEIDEILTLRILTLTDEEKRAAAGLDNRARDLLQRTEALTREQLYSLHGVMRNPHPLSGGGT